MRVLLFTGKGGVGKTTTAAATALHLARSGARVVITSADPAHSLADSFGLGDPSALGSEPTEVAPGCEAQQLDSRERLEQNWGEIREWMLQVFDWAGVAAMEAEELAVVPGLEELFALSEVESLCASGRYDVVVVDCAPTAETVRLLSLPDVLSWYMERLFPASRRLNKVVAPIVGRVTSLPVADDSVFLAGQRFYDQLEGVRRILADPKLTSARLVVNPERMVLSEARRTYTYLSLFGYQVDAVVVNRVLPAEPGGEWLERWRATQAEHLASIDEDFAPLPVFRAEHAGGEVVGVDALTRLGDQLWAGIDPRARLVEARPLRISRRGDHLVLSVELPFVERSAVDLTRTGDELSVTVGPHRRNLVLPDSLRRRAVEGATLVDGRLEVVFGGPGERAVRADDRAVRRS